MDPHRHPRAHGRSRLFLALLGLVPTGLAGCYDSQPTPTDGDRPDAADAREDGSPGDAGEATGVHFDPDLEAPAPGTLWLAEESTDGTSLVLRLMVDGDQPVYGLAARLRWDGTRAALRDVQPCGPFAGHGPAWLEWRTLAPEPEAWLGLAVPSRDALAPVAGGACALLLLFDILGPGSSRIELVPGRSAAVGSPPTRYVTAAVGGGTLEVTR